MGRRVIVAVSGTKSQQRKCRLGLTRKLSKTKQPNTMRPHPWQSRKVLKESYSKHVSGLLIIKMSRAEQKIREEIRKEQIKYWSKEEIKAQYG